MSVSVDLSLYLVTDARQCASRGLVETVLEAVRGGVTIVQLRDPEAETRALVESARALVAALRPAGVPLIVNDRVDVALAAGAAGVHLGQKDMHPADARRLLGPGGIIGLSVGSADEHAASDLGPVDYIGIGPVAATATKSDAGKAIGVAGFAAVHQLSDRPAVAIGGIKPEHCKDLIAAGASGVAVVSAICAAADPFAAAVQFTDSLRAARQRA